MKKIVRGIGCGLVAAGAVYALGIVGSRDRGIIEFSELVSGEAIAMLIVLAGATLVKLSQFSLTKFKEAYKNGRV